MADHNQDSEAYYKTKTEEEFNWIKEKADAYVAKSTPD